MTRMNSRIAAARHARQGGFSLIELMIAMLIGLLVTVAAIGVFLSNKKTYTATEGIGHIQENTAITFELMSRDIREAGGRLCGAETTVTNVAYAGLSGDVKLLADWATESGTPNGSSDAQNGPTGMQGYEAGVAMPGVSIGTATAQRIAGTDAIQVQYVQGGSARLRYTDGSTFYVDNTDDLTSGGLLYICQFGSMKEASDGSGQSVSDGNKIGSVFIGTVSSGKVVPASSIGKYVGYQDPSASGSATTSFTVDGVASTSMDMYASQLGMYHAAQWYVGNNAQGGKSLYRKQLSYASGAPTVVTEEVADGVDDLQIQYKTSGTDAWVAAADVSEWATVRAVRIAATLEATDTKSASSNGEVLKRTYSHVVALRNLQQWEEK